MSHWYLLTSEIKSIKASKGRQKDWQVKMKWTKKLNWQPNETLLTISLDIAKN